MAATAAYTVEDQERMTRATNYFSWQHRLAARRLGRRVLEIGCGIGNFTSLLLDREAVLAIDAEPSCIEKLRARFADQLNLQAITCDAASPQFRSLVEFKPDSCVCLNVLEHIEDDREALRGMAEVLVPGGVAVLIVPAFPALYGPIDELLGHHRRYTRASIAALAKSAGFRLREAHYFNAIGFFGWWINAHVLKRRAQSAAQIEFFDRYVVPFSSRAEKLLHPPFGQSLFVVLET
ncbi:MAG TPA: class I SAM-dependent methyltransferase [Bryobacteraceae bacterium]|nr:class I SAM-dependent methyltransferase [Bryobacteraceae bacterium]